MESVTPKQVIAMFKECDADSDGKLNLGEFKNIMVKLSKMAGEEDPTQEMSEDDIQTLIDVIDTNQDGSIQVEELVAFFFQGNDLIAAVTEMFQLYDLDNSGSVTLEENIKVDKMIAEAFGKPFDEAEARANFKKSDENSDQKVNLEEFLNYIESTIFEPCRKEGMDDDAIKEKFAPMYLRMKVISCVTNMFKLYDVDNSGFITLDENIKLDTHVAVITGQPFDEKECREEFAKRDVNSDGKVTLDEFVTNIITKIIEPARKEAAEEEEICFVMNEVILAKLKLVSCVMQMFKLQDLDGSGALTLDEVLTLEKKNLERMGLEFNEEEAKAFFALADTDSDKKVSLDEFTTFMGKRIKEGLADTDDLADMLDGFENILAEMKQTKKALANGT